MKNILIITLSILSFSSCQQKVELPKIEMGNLHKVDVIKVNVVENKLEILINDESYIYFDDYIILKSDVLLNNNYEKIKKFDSIKVSFTQRERPEIFIKKYSQKQLDSIHKEFQGNEYLERNYSILVTDFDVSEIWNLRSEVLNVSRKIKDEIELDYLSLIKIYSKHQKEKDDIRKSAVYDRMVLIRDMFSEIGIEDVWSKERKKSPEFITKLNSILEK